MCSVITIKPKHYWTLTIKFYKRLEKIPVLNDKQSASSILGFEFWILSTDTVKEADFFFSGLINA